MKKLFILLGITVLYWACEAVKVTDNTTENVSVISVKGHLYSKPFPLVRIKENQHIRNVFLLGSNAIKTNELFREFKSKIGHDPEGMKIEIEFPKKSIQAYSFGLLSDNIHDMYTLSEGGEERRNFKIGASEQYQGVVISPKCYWEYLESGDKMSIECVKQDIKEGDPLLFLAEGQNESIAFLLSHASGLSLGVGIYPYLGKKIDILAQEVQIDNLQVLKVAPDKGIKILENSRLFID